MTAPVSTSLYKGEGEGEETGGYPLAMLRARTESFQVAGVGAVPPPDFPYSTSLVGRSEDLPESGQLLCVPGNVHDKLV